MVYKRYDHRKMAFRHRMQKKRQSILEDTEIRLPSRRRKSLEYGGYLGGGDRRWRTDAQQYVDEQSTNTKRRRTRKSKNSDQQKERRRGRIIQSRSSSSSYSEDEYMEKYHKRGGRRNTIIYMKEDDDLDVLNKMIADAEQQCLDKERQKMSEEFGEIKARFAQIFYEYDKENDEILDEYGLPLLDFENVAESEKDTLQSNINGILKFYSTVCSEREEVLVKLHEALDADVDELNGRNSPLSVDDLDIISEQLLVLIEGMDSKTERLQRVHDKLKELVSYGVQFGGYGSGNSRKEQLQLKVVEKFKRLKEGRTKEKEKVDTWKHAASEIVGLLNNVRHEGSMDFEHIESELKKMVAAFTEQSLLLEEKEALLTKQKKTLQDKNIEVEKCKNENLLMHDQLKTTRKNLKEAQIKNVSHEGTISSLKALAESKNSSSQDTVPEKIEKQATSSQGEWEAQQKVKKLEKELEDCQTDLKNVKQQLKLLESKQSEKHAVSTEDQSHSSFVIMKSEDYSGHIPKNLAAYIRLKAYFGGLIIGKGLNSSGNLC